jgi:hypothetical protein
MNELKNFADLFMNELNNLTNVVIGKLGKLFHKQYCSQDLTGFFFRMTTQVKTLVHLDLHPSTHAEKETCYIQY